MELGCRLVSAMCQLLTSARQQGSKDWPPQTRDQQRPFFQGLLCGRRREGLLAGWRRGQPDGSDEVENTSSERAGRSLQSVDVTSS